MSEKKRIYGLIGFPVKHSLSPLMHNAAFAYLKQQKEISFDAEYKLFELKPQDLDGFLSSLSSKNIFGLNVTIPYKEKVLDFVTLDEESAYLKQIKAVNTISKVDNKWLGFNTDIPGFAKHLKENINPENKKAAVLGAGGAAKAVVYVIANYKVKEIVVYDIDKDKANNLVSLMKSLIAGLNIKSVDSVEQLDILNKDLLVNATPIGMKETDKCLVKEEMLHKNLFVYDLIYNPRETKLLALAKKAGAKTSNGLGMLLYQGMLSFEIWTGKPAPKEVMWEALNSCI